MWICCCLAVYNLIGVCINKGSLSHELNCMRAWCLAQSSKFHLISVHPLLMTLILSQGEKNCPCGCPWGRELSLWFPLGVEMLGVQKLCFFPLSQGAQKLSDRSQPCVRMLVAYGKVYRGGSIWPGGGGGGGVITAFKSCPLGGLQFFHNLVGVCMPTK